MMRWILPDHEIDDSASEREGNRRKALIKKNHRALQNMKISGSLIKE